ncbi:MAG TPA: transcriptional regulator NrdR [Actinomycetota bacterium]|nr:transcriptional regulator NrdR [Actinomycetota bacterium]
MRCPTCGEDQDRVVDSRVAEDGHAIRRRRECEGCGQRFTTFERMENAPLLVAKRSGGRQSFDREKLLSGIRKACKNRQVAPETLDRLVDDIVETIRLEGRTVVSSADLGRDVLERLRDIDEVAYLRFASVYKDFKELNDFERELGLLAKKVPPKQPAGVPEE